MAYRKVRVSQALVSQDPSTKNLVPPTSAAVYIANSATLATLYSDLNGTPLSNPVPTGVTPGPTAVGLDTSGNLIVYVDIPGDYDVLSGGVKEPLSTPPMHNHDITDHVDGTKADPHGDRQWFLANLPSFNTGTTTAVFG